MTQVQPPESGYKVFLVAGINDFLRTRLGEVRGFTTVADAQAAALAAGGGMVLPWDAPAPAGFDRPTF